MRIYVGNLSYDVTEDELQREFAAFGQVSAVTIPGDGRSRGFGFVEMPTKEEAEAAIAGLNGKSLRDRTIAVSEARPRAEAGGGGGFRRGPPHGGGSRGGYGREGGGGGGGRQRRY